MPAPALPTIEDGHSFAFMAVPHLKHEGAGLWAGQVIAKNGFSATSALKVELSEAWRADLGSKTTARVTAAGFYILVTSAEAHDEVFRQLRQQVHFAYFTCLLSVGFIDHDLSYLLDGRVEDGKMSVKNYAEYPRVLCPSQAPRGKLTKAALERGFVRAKAVSQLFENAAHPRFGRILFAFLQALTHRELDRRLHQFVRCVEGFVYPGRSGLKKRFVERAQLFIGQGSVQRSLLTNLWDVRSVVEHLHGPFEAIDAPGERGRRLRLLRRAIEAEAIARHCIETFLDHPQLWEHFTTNAAAENFWQLSGKKRRDLWGASLELSMLDYHFDEADIDNRALGLEGETPGAA
jgi:hypothetical protein